MKQARFGFCRLMRRWVLRDRMRALKVHWWDVHNREHVIRIRLSPIGAAQLIATLRALAWDNDVRTRDQIPPTEEVQL